jgi:DNA-binding NarL/FixJ family response regulator
MAIRVLLADDHQVILDGLKLLLAGDPEIEVVGEATDGLQVFPLVDALQPAVVVLDLMMPGMHGLEVVRQAAKRTPELRIIVLSMHANDAYVVEALRLGARGYVLKQADSRAVAEAIRVAAAGGRYLSPPLSMERVEAFERTERKSRFDPFDTLSTRERVILKLAADGLTSRQIAKRLDIGKRTVDTHRANLFRKLHIDTHADLVRFAVKRGLVD